MGIREKAGQQGLLFLEKKKQKDFARLGSEPNVWQGTNVQKFFGSFFQERTRFLSPAREKDTADGR
ncbi:MAG: hypothetical protein ACRYG6_09385 [Janthinobacterium lividum]